MRWDGMGNVHVLTRDARAFTISRLAPDIRWREAGALLRRLKCKKSILRASYLILTFWPPNRHTSRARDIRYVSAENLTTPAVLLDFLRWELAIGDHTALHFTLKADPEWGGGREGRTARYVFAVGAAKGLTSDAAYLERTSGFTGGICL